MEEIKCKCECGQTIPLRDPKGPRQRLFVDASHRLKFHKIKDWSLLKPVPPEIAKARQKAARDARKADGKCVHCGNEPAVEGRVLGPICRDKNNSRRKASRPKKELDSVASPVVE